MDSRSCVPNNLHLVCSQHMIQVDLPSVQNWINLFETARSLSSEKIFLKDKRWCYRKREAKKRSTVKAVNVGVNHISWRQLHNGLVLAWTLIYLTLRIRKKTARDDNKKNKTENGSVSKRQQKFHKIWWGRFVTFVQSTWLLPQSYPKLPTFSKVPQSSPKFPKALEKFPKATLNSQNLPKVTQSFRKFLKVTRNSPKASLSYSRLP